MESRDAEIWIVEGIDSRIIKLIMQINVDSIELKWNWIKNLDEWQFGWVLAKICCTLKSGNYFLPLDAVYLGDGSGRGLQSMKSSYNHYWVYWISISTEWWVQMSKSKTVKPNAGSCWMLKSLGKNARTALHAFI